MVRTDARPEIGYGHFFRCLALMEAMAEAGASCLLAGMAPDYIDQETSRFAQLDVPGGMADWDQPSFVKAVDRADLLVTDLYEINADWQARSPTPVLAIADPPLSSLHCDLLLLPTSFQAPENQAALTAPAHALIRSSFAAQRYGPKTGMRVLINCGGGEDRELAFRVVAAIANRTELADIEGIVVLGEVKANYADRVRAQAESVSGLIVVDQVTDMATLIAQHDIAIGTPAGGALERAALGLAQILVPIADNQLTLGAALAARGAAITLEYDASGALVAEALVRLLADQVERASVAAAGFKLIDGQGAARVAAAAAERYGS